MRYLFVCVLAVLPSLAIASHRLPVRPVDATASAALDLAVDQSATARALVQRLEASNVIVHVESSRALPHGLDGMTRFVVSRGGYRYLRITIDADLPHRARAAILAHELQHACEVADSNAEDVESLRALFAHRGRHTGEFYETAAAIEAQRHVKLELHATRTLQAEPVIKFDH